MSEKRKRGAIISVRVSGEELAELQRSADRHGSLISTFLRELALDTARHSLAAEVAELKVEVAFLRAELLARQPIVVQPYTPPYAPGWPYPYSQPLISNGSSGEATVHYIGSAS